MLDLKVHPWRYFRVLLSVFLFFKSPLAKSYVETMCSVYMGLEKAYISNVIHSVTHWTLILLVYTILYELPALDTVPMPFTSLCMQIKSVKSIKVHRIISPHFVVLAKAVWDRKIWHHQLTYLRECRRKRNAKWRAWSQSWDLTWQFQIYVAHLHSHVHVYGI